MANKAFTISGTEIGAILGLSPYMTPMDLYMRKLGLIDPPAETEAMRWGSAAEHVVARRYARETGHALFPSTDTGYDYHNPLSHPEFPWWTGTPDRKILPNAETVMPGLLEIKIVGERMAHQWGDPPGGDVPEQYLTQCAWYMPILGVEWVDLAVQIGNRDYRVYRIERDRELEDQLWAEADAFIKNHLIPEIPPEIDASDSSRRYLNYRYPEDREPMLESEDAEILLTIGSYRSLLVKQKDLETEVDYFQNRLKEIIGENAGLKGQWGSITWKKNKDSKKIDWEGICKVLNPDSELVDHYTTIRPGARVLRAKFKEDA